MFLLGIVIVLCLLFVAILVRHRCGARGNQFVFVGSPWSVEDVTGDELS